MKKRLLFSIGLVLCASAGVKAQFSAASLPEFLNPSVANVALNASTTNCHSYGNVQTATGFAYDIYAHCFDGVTGSMPPYTYNCGIAWRLRNTTTSAITSGYISNPISGVDVFGSDIAILQQNNGDILFAVVYNQPSVGFYIAYFKLDPVANSATLVGSPTQLLASTTNPSTIHIDVNEKKNFVVTFGANFRLYACAGQVSSGSTPTLGSVVQLTPNTSLNTMPDVALCNSSTSGLQAHFVYENYSNFKIEEAKLSFSTLLSATSTATPSIEDITGGGYDAFYVRIDCPDHSTNDMYSYVYMSERMGTTGPLHPMTTGIKNATGSIYHLVLNTATVSPYPTDLSSDKNLWPAVAFDKTNNFIHYSWVYGGNLMVPQFGTPIGYIGVTLNGNTLMSNNYWMMELNPANDIRVSPSVALSGQNDQTPNLYTTMTYKDGGGTGDYINCKIVPWLNSGFRSTGVEEISINSLQATVAPNPSTTGFNLTVTNADNKQLHAQLIDISGRRLFSADGDLTKINAGLYQASQNLSAGIYFINLSADGVNGSQQLKVVKQ